MKSKRTESQPLFADQFPNWSALPADAQREILKVLAQMMKQNVAPASVPGTSNSTEKNS